EAIRQDRLGEQSAERRLVAGVCRRGELLEVPLAARVIALRSGEERTGLAVDAADTGLARQVLELLVVEAVEDAGLVLLDEGLELPDLAGLPFVLLLDLHVLLLALLGAVGPRRPVEVGHLRLDQRMLEDLREERRFVPRRLRATLAG